MPRSEKPITFREAVIRDRLQLPLLLGAIAGAAYVAYLLHDAWLTGSLAEPPGSWLLALPIAFLFLAIPVFALSAAIVGFLRWIINERSKPQPAQTSKVSEMIPHVLVLFSLSTAAPLLAQEAVNPATKPGQVQITFLPPPMEGTVSLGIYNKAGKLVRVLKREANPEKDFVVGLNGLITTWDGKDNQGAASKPGVYAVRGFLVRGVEMSGEAFHCNDWVSGEEAPHPREIKSLWMLPNDRLALAVKLADGSGTKLECGLDGQLRERKEADVEQDDFVGLKAQFLAAAKQNKVEFKDGKPTIGAGGAPLPELHEPLDLSYGKDGTVWIIDRTPERVEVQQYSAKGEFLRRLGVGPGEPVPVGIAASTTSDLIFLLEEAKGLQRVRGLALESLSTPLPDSAPTAEGAPKSSTWRIVFSKTIRASDDFATAAPFLSRSELPKPEAAIPIKLGKNPLAKKGDTSVEALVVCEPGGSFLSTVQGLPLCRLTDTAGLKWAVLLRTDNGLHLLQSDGAVVEEYKLGKLSSMMPFDAGEYELK